MQDYLYPADQVAGGGITVADLSGDGLYDIVLAHYGQDQLYIGQPDGSFVDETASRWPDIESMSSAATAADVEGDGDLDLYLTNMWGDDHLLLNDGSGHFSDGTAAAGLSGRGRRGMGASFGDMDGDGDLDLFIADYLWCVNVFDASIGLEITECDHDPAELAPQSLWENLGDGRFVDVTDERMPPDTLPYALSHGAAWIDVDGDGDQDIYQFNDYRSEIEWVEPNHLYLNDGTGHFAEAPDRNADRYLASMGLGIADISGDGYPDFLLSDTYKITLLESLGEPDWYESALLRGLELSGEDGRESGWGTELVDLDNDGDLDAPMLFGRVVDTSGEIEEQRQPDAIYIQGEDGSFEQVAEQWGFANTEISRSLAVIDIDGDGWVELIRGALDAPALMYSSRCGAAHWIEVHLRDSGPNPYAIGAAVRVTAGGRERTAWILAGGTSIHTSLQPLARFGLGAAERVDTLAITWPDGGTSIFNDITADQRVTVTRE